MEPILIKHTEYIAFIKDSLLQDEANLFDEWLSSINLKQESKEEFKVQKEDMRYMMFSQLVDTISGEFSETAIREMARKIASERMNQIDIGDVLYGINQGRRIITNAIMRMDVPVESLRIVINDVNRQFDIFSHELVSTYYQLANQVIDEKTSFINDNHKDKLALLGQISSSFVHEFRNPLTAVMGFNKILKKEYPGMKYLDIMDYELNQLNFRITQFLHTSKAELNEDLVVDISIKELIEEIKQLSYASIIDTNVKVEIDVADGLKIKASKNGLKQVILNVFVNSIDALKNVPFERIIKVKASLKNDQLLISLSNNGPMIEKEYLDSIFEPFFTTKELGTGIGLYVCRKIIESYDGYLVCTSVPEWTTFCIHLPDSILIKDK